MGYTWLYHLYYNWHQIHRVWFQNPRFLANQAPTCSYNVYTMLLKSGLFWTELGSLLTDSDAASTLAASGIQMNTALPCTARSVKWCILHSKREVLYLNWWIVQCANGYGGYNWNTSLFPSPPTFQQWLVGTLRRTFSKNRNSIENAAVHSLVYREIWDCLRVPLLKMMRKWNEKMMIL